MSSSYLESIPAEWRSTQIRDVVDTTKQSVDPRKYPGETFDYYSIPAYQAGGSIPELGANIGSAKLKVLDGTVLFGKLNPRVPKVWRVNNPSHRRKIASTEFLPLRAHTDKIDDLFLYYLCWSDFVMPKAQALVSGSTPSRQRVDAARFVELSVPLPPLAEQRAIAEALRAVQRAKEQTEQIIDAVRRLKTSLIEELIVRADHPHASLGQVVEKPQYGFTASADKEPKGPRFVRITDIQEGNVNWSTVPFCKCTEHDLEKYGLRSGDILIARIGATTGKSFRVEGIPEEAVFASYLIRLRPREIDGLYLEGFLQSSAYWSQVNAQKGGRLKSGVNSHVLGNLLVPLPTLDHQKRIGSTLVAFDHKIDAEQQRRDTLDQLFKSLLHELMTGRTRLNLRGKAA